MASKADNGGGRRGIPWRIVGWGTAAFLLLLPLIANAPWTLSDYLFAGGMFALVGGTLEVAARTSRNPYYRGGVLVAVAATFLLVWINGAVGIIGDEGNPANLMFLVVILVALSGAIVARFQADGMARAMTAAAVVQALVAAIVVAGRLGANEPPGLVGVLGLIGFFALMWLGSAWLFRKAARA
jgi:hypothetical protein